MGSNASMYDSLVSTNTTRGTERFAALLARERPLVRVYPVVDPQNVHRVESLPARITLELPLVRVVHEMLPILCHHVERLAADLASLLRGRIVNRPVYEQPAPELEFLPADAASVLLAVRMHVQVADEILRVLAAYFAHFPVVVF